jgi:ankyrin repeat protein
LPHVNNSVVSQEKLLPGTKSVSQVSPGLSDLENNNGQVIRLKYDTKQSARDPQHKVVLRVFYWASFMGKTEIVEHLIRLGYSPHLKSYARKSAFTAAVESGNKDLLALILSFNYIPTNPAKFNRSVVAPDKDGNTAMRYACKMMRKDLKEELGKMGVDFNHRNYRGLAADEMTHKKLVVLY